MWNRDHAADRAAKLAKGCCFGPKVDTEEEGPQDTWVALLNGDPPKRRVLAYRATSLGAQLPRPRSRCSRTRISLRTPNWRGSARILSVESCSTRVRSSAPLSTANGPARRLHSFRDPTAGIATLTCGGRTCPWLTPKTWTHSADAIDLDDRGAAYAQVANLPGSLWRHSPLSSIRVVMWPSRTARGEDGELGGIDAVGGLGELVDCPPAVAEQRAAFDGFPVVISRFEAFDARDEEPLALAVLLAFELELGLTHRDRRPEIGDVQADAGLLERFAAAAAAALSPSSIPPPGVSHHGSASGRPGSKPWSSSTDSSAIRSTRPARRWTITVPVGVGDRRRRDGQLLRRRAGVWSGLPARVLRQPLSSRLGRP